MPHPEPYPRCIFCGAKANSREHAIPAWIGKRFNLRKEELRLVYAREVTPRRRQPVMFGSHRERIFCRGCNEHFKHLEDEAIPVVEWMARGRAIQLGPHEQDILTRWGAKTGYALLAAARYAFMESVPEEHRRLLRFHGVVTACTSVSYGAWRGHINRVVSTDLLKSDRPDDVPRSYMVIFTFAQIALQVFGMSELPPGGSFVLHRKGLKQVWPRTNSHYSWPPPGPLSDEHLAQLMNSLSD